MIRVLVALSPRMYREAVALSVHRRRPGLVDVRIVPPGAAGAELASFRPHLLVHDELSIPEAAFAATPCRLEISYTFGMDARLHGADGRTTELSDASTQDLLGAVDAAAPLADRRLASAGTGLPQKATRRVTPRPQP